MSKHLKSLLFIGASVLAGLSLSAGVSKASSVVNEHGNALTSYIKSSHFHFVHNAHYVEPSNYSDNYNHNVDPTRTLHYVGGNEKVNYHPYAQLEDQAGNYNPQSVVIDRNGTTYVSYRVGPTQVQIARYQNINNNDGLSLHGVHYGPVFNGGHGQAMALNPKTDQLWLLYNPYGSANNTKLFEISKASLKPIRQIDFHMEPYAMGDTLAFDNQGNAYMSLRSGKGGAAPEGSLKLFKGKVTNGSVRFHMVQGLRYAPGAIMQNMSYNPSNNRIYFITDGEIMSVPANHYDHLKPSDVKATKLSGHYEFEDLAFYHGKGFLLVHYPSELLISDNAVNAKHTTKVRNHASKIRKNSRKKNVNKTKRNNKRKFYKKHARKNAKKVAKKTNKKAIKRNKKWNAKKTARKGHKATRKNVRRHNKK